jgi:enamine deaminase RidA (YjgF/YER057c/UK114 family)
MARFDQIVYAEEDIERKLGFPRFVRSGNTLYMSGLLSADEKFELVGPGDMVVQMRRIYTRFEGMLAKVGANLQHVTSEILFATDLQALMTASHVRREFYAKHNASIPASTAVQVVALALPGAMLEIHPTVEVP